MKKLTKQNRETVRFLIQRALHDLEIAKTIAFKAYGSHETSAHISTALILLEQAVDGLKNTRLSNHKQRSPSTSLAPDKKDCQKRQEIEPKTAKKVEEDAVARTFREIVCAHLGVSPEQCAPQARLVEDLGADELDPIELSMLLEVEFGIAFSDEEVSGFSTYEKLLNLVKEKIEEKNNESKES